MNGALCGLSANVEAKFVRMNALLATLNDRMSLFREELKNRLDVLETSLKSAESSTIAIRNELASLESLVRNEGEKRMASLESSTSALHTEFLSLNHVVKVMEPQRFNSLESSVSALNSEFLSINHLVRAESVKRLASLESAVGALHDEFLSLSHGIRVELPEKIAIVRNQLGDHKMLLVEQQHILETIRSGDGGEKPVAGNNAPIASGETAKCIASRGGHDLDSFYVSFEEAFRGERKMICERLGAAYFDKVKTAVAASGDKGIVDVIDLGCGRGEWLELLCRNKFKAVGVDANRHMTECCRKLGLNVVDADAIEYMEEIERESVSVVTGFQIVEHLPFESLLRLFDATLKALRHGGIAIFETPNPDNIKVGSYSFYYDPTHIKPIPAPTLKFLLENRGFAEVEIVKLNPDPTRYFEEDKLNASLFGARDYAAIGSRA